MSAAIASPPPPYTESVILSSPGLFTPQESLSDVDDVSDSSDPLGIYSQQRRSYTHTSPSTVDGALAFEDTSISSAEAYFRSRPAQGLTSLCIIPHFITICTRTQPNDLPYPDRLAARNVLSEDWTTFLQHLLPGRLCSGNDEVAEGQQRADFTNGQMQQLSLTCDDSQGEASQHQIASERTVNKADEVIRLWNQGFFGPRGIHVRNTGPEMFDENKMQTIPQDWICDAPLRSSRGQTAPQEMGLEALTRESEAGIKSSGGRRSIMRGINFVMNPRSILENSSQGFKVGSIAVDNNGLRIGNLVADRSGFRVGEAFSANVNGLVIGGRAYGRKIERDEHGTGRGEHFRGRGRGRGEHHHRGRGKHHHRGKGEHHRGHERGHSRHRGRSHGRQERPASSSSCSDTASSDSSVGSVHTHPHVHDHQLPVANQTLLSWVSNPQLPITSELVSSIRKSIKNADGPSQIARGTKASRSEIRDLLKEFHEQSKAAKKERRARKKAEEKERSAAKKAATRAQGVGRGEDQEMNRHVESSPSHRVQDERILHTFLPLGRYERQAGSGARERVIPALPRQPILAGRYDTESEEREGGLPIIIRRSSIPIPEPASWELSQSDSPPSLRALTPNGIIIRAQSTPGTPSTLGTPYRPDAVRSNWPFKPHPLSSNALKIHEPPLSIDPMTSGSKFSSPQSSSEPSWSRPFASEHAQVLALEALASQKDAEAETLGAQPRADMMEGPVQTKIRRLRDEAEECRREASEVRRTVREAERSGT